MKEKHVLIMTDLEGISMVDNISMMQGEGYESACRFLMEDLNAAVDGAFAGGAKKVSVVDGHGTGKNFPEGLLDPRAVQVPTLEFCRGPLHEYDVVLSIGCHAKAGTEKSFLDHTQSSASWFDYCVNGKSLGEIGQQAILSGAYGIPLVMVSGDEAACIEARSLIPNIACAAVKTAEIRNEALCLPEEEAHRRIYEAAKDGVLRSDEIAPYKITLPARLELTLYRSDYCDQIMSHARGVSRSGRTLTKTIETVQCLYDLVF